MKRATDEYPATPVVPFEAQFGLVRAKRTFICDGIRIEQGTVLDGNSDFVRAIVAEHPDVVELLKGAPSG